MCDINEQSLLLLIPDSIIQTITLYLDPFDIIQFSVTCKKTQKLAKEYDRKFTINRMCKLARESYSNTVSLFQLGYALSKTCIICNNRFGGKFDPTFQVYAHKECVRTKHARDFEVIKNMIVPINLFWGQTQIPRIEINSYYHRSVYFWRENDGCIAPKHTVDWHLLNNPRIEELIRQYRERREMKAEDEYAVKVRKFEQQQLEKMKAEEDRQAKKRIRNEQMKDPFLRKKIRIEEGEAALQSRRHRFVSRYGESTLTMMETHQLSVLGDFLDSKKSTTVTLRHFTSRLPTKRDMMVEYAPNGIENFIMDRLQQALHCTCVGNTKCPVCTLHAFNKGWIAGCSKCIVCDEYVRGVRQIMDHVICNGCHRTGRSRLIESESTFISPNASTAYDE